MLRYALLKYLLPYKGMSYFLNYISVTDTILREKQKPRRARKNYTLCIYLILALFVYYIGQYTYLALAPSLTAFDRFLHNDLVFILANYRSYNSLSVIYAMWVILMVMGPYFYYQFYLNVSPRFHLAVNRIFVQPQVRRVALTVVNCMHLFILLVGTFPFT